MVDNVLTIDLLLACLVPLLDATREPAKNSLLPTLVTGFVQALAAVGGHPELYESKTTSVCNEKHNVLKEHPQRTMEPLQKKISTPIPKSLLSTWEWSIKIMRHDYARRQLCDTIQRRFVSSPMWFEGTASSLWRSPRVFRASTSIFYDVDWRDRALTLKVAQKFSRRPHLSDVVGKAGSSWRSSNSL